MATILIVCGAGASSTFLATRLRSLAAIRGLDLAVQAASDSDIEARLESIDVLLVGAHLAPAFDRLNARAMQSGVAAALLPSTVFGQGGAEAALDLALGLAARPPCIPHPNEGNGHG